MVKLAHKNNINFTDKSLCSYAHTPFVNYHAMLQKMWMVDFEKSSSPVALSLKNLQKHCSKVKFVS